MQREPTLNEQLKIRFSSGAEQLYGGNQSNIKQWFVNRYFMIDKEWAEEERKNWLHDQ